VSEGIKNDFQVDTQRGLHFIIVTARSQDDCGLGPLRYSLEMNTNIS
jgi:hypothetical protein